MESMESEKIFMEVERQRTEMVNGLIDLIRIPAVGPENGGDGELKKAERLIQLLENVGFDRIERYDAEDSRVSSRKRPNVVAYCGGGQDSKRLWIVTHMDIVPAGEESLWTVTRPFEPTVKEGRIYGRGSEDNGQSLIASIFAVKALKNLGMRPKKTVALAFVADEEQGSTYGIQHLIKRGLFQKDDLIIVPDAGSEDGGFIEITEKSLLWLRIRTIGKQTHASLPHKGLNAHRVGMGFALAVDRMLHEKYSLKDAYFDVPESTFEPTKKDKNVDAVNIIPGEDIIYCDCRILPNYDPEEIISDVEKLATEFEKRTGANIRIETVQKQVAPKLINGNSEMVNLLKEAIKRARGIEPRVGGIGGGTCAAFFRKMGVPAVVWSTVEETAHQPNEYARIDNIVNDAKIYALLGIM
ncbi:MAG: M20 family metallo-hydrolase [Candidatus Bathycorpusculaceae bacterium]